MAHPTPDTAASASTPWMREFADRLFSREPKRRIRLVQTALAILFTLSGLGVMQYNAWTGFASWQVVVPWTLVALGGYAGFFAAIRSGWSERFADPSLTMAQMAYAVACCASGYAVAGAMRGMVFPLLMVVLMFGMFALTPRQVLAISLYAVALFGLVMWLMSRWRPQTFPPEVEWGHFLMLAAMMPAASVLAGQLSRLQARLRQQRRTLTEALEQIKVLATRDDLTGLVNRRHMNDLLENERQRSLRTGSGFCIALIDLDHFKRINDAHGHAAGDEVLRAFAREGTRLLRGTDLLSRWGGEEFLLFMPTAAAPGACEAAERLRRAVEGLGEVAGKTVLEVTMSAGVAQHRSDESIAELIERADHALYRAKMQGRNQIVFG